MATPNRTSYAILGLLADGPKSGYAIRQVVEQTLRHFWKESFGHIYPTLNKLAAAGLIAPEAEASSGRTDQRRYQITPQGREELERWLAAELEPEGVRNELALKLYFGRHAPLAVSRAHLQAHRAHYAALLAQYTAERSRLEMRAAAGDADATFMLITLDLGEHIARARISWCDAALERLMGMQG
jgi:PadR family transcriptional regulator, regulatory protein AphA